MNCIFSFCILLTLKGIICNPIAKDNETFTKENNVKKGSIRIQGPWHSESALDRNVDPAEDSYVKKIISSNEGLNFNKDMAEAGEMFDVNGIEDFYDKNAMITYEVNGHEVPVHMKPKLTPQSKSMFPEYIRETPAAMGLTRQASKPDSRLHNYQRLNARIDSPFAGFTSKDMPEYNVHDSPELHEGNKYNLNLGLQKFLHDHASHYGKDIHAGLRLPWKTADSSGQLNRPDEHSKLLEGFESNPIKSPKLSSARILDAYRQNTENELKNIKYFHHKGDTNRQSTEPSERIEEQKSVEMDRPISKYYQDHSQHDSHSNIDNEHDSFVKASPQDREMLHHSLENQLHPDEDTSDISKFHHGIAAAEHIAGSDRNEGEMPHNNMETVNTNSESNLLFAKLEDLHKKLAGSNNRESEVSSLNDKNQESTEPEKAKAKTRILTLLGELSAKLKGMEAAVSGHHVNKVEQINSKEEIQDTINQRLSNRNDHGSTPMFGKSDEDAQNSDSVLSSLENPALPHLKTTQNFYAGEASQNEVVDHTASERQKSEKEVQDDRTELLTEESSLEKPETRDKSKEELSEPTLKEKNLFRADKEKQALEIAEQNEKDNEKAEETAKNNNNKKEEEETNAEENLHNLILSYKAHQTALEKEKVHLLPETISNYREEGTPFIMDTDSIDYKPSKDDKILSNVNEDDDETSNTEEVHKHTKKHKYDKEESDEELPKRHQHKSKHNQKDKFQTHLRKTFHKHLRKESEDEDEEESKDNKSDGKKTYDENKKKGIKHDDGDDDDDEEEKKVDDVAESIVSDEEHDSGLSRERTYRPDSKVAEEIEYPDYNDVKDAAVFETNILRKNYHANKINWSDRLSDKAQQSAEKIARNTQGFDINKIEKQPGENVALVKLDSANVGKDAIDKWAREARNYDFKSPTITNKNSDFVQLMWKADKEFGMGVAKSRNEKGWIVTSFFDNPSIDKFQDLRLNLQSEVPMTDPYGDIVG